MKEDENNLSSSSDENLQYDQVLASKELKIEQLEAEVLKLKDELGERDRVYDEKVLKLSSQLAEVLDSMELHAKALRDSTIIKRATSDAEGDRDLLDSLQHELKGYRVQSQQYARTICVLEERLLELTREASEAQAEVIRLRAENKLNEKDFFSQGVQTGSDNRIIKNFSLNRHERRCELIELRNEVDALSTLRADLSKEIQQLREQKVIAEAKANDIISTATGKLKQETEAALEINGELHSQLNIAKKQIDELTDTVKKLKSQLSDKEKALIRAKASVQLTRKALNAEEEKVAHLEALEASRRNGSTSGCKHDRPFLRKAPSAESNCQSAGHEETIEAQRTALAEMRQRLHYLSSNTSNGLSPDELISLEEAHRREVLGLRRQIKELRIQLECSRRGSSRWIKEYSSSAGNGSDGDIASDLFSDNDLFKILKNLEENYFLLIHTFCQFFSPSSALLIRRSCIDPANSELRERIWIEQQKFAVSVKSKLNMLFNQLKRNASTIQSYETQMAKLRKEAQAVRGNGKAANE